jgi:hypothetical protein
VVKNAVAKVREDSPAWQLFQDGVALAPMGWV